MLQHPRPTDNISINDVWLSYPGAKICIRTDLAMPYLKKVMAKTPKTFVQSPKWNNPESSKTIKEMKRLTKQFEKELMTSGKATMKYAIKASDGYHVPIITGNSKLGGAFKSLSFRPVIDCGNCAGCAGSCYDLRHDVTNKACMELRCLTAAIYNTDPERFWREVDASMTMTRLLRLHVGGEFLSQDYFDNMARLASKHKHVKLLAFTKMYEYVNHYIDENGSLPENFHVIMSAWPGVVLDNPHNLPISFPVFASEDIEKDAKLLEFQNSMPKFYWHCNDDCTDCALSDQGCFKLGKGESVGFNYH